MATGIEQQVDEYGARSVLPAVSDTAVYLGTKARLVPLTNGLAVEILDGTGIWVRQAQWTEA